MRTTLLTTIASAAALATAACGDDSSDDPQTTVAATSDTGSGSDAGDGTPDDGDPDDDEGGTADPPGTSTGAGDGPGDGSTSGEADGSSGTAGGSDDTAGSSGTGSEAGFHPEFVWFGDFVREKCVACHNEGQNGNLLLPSVDMTNDEVRLALDGGVATTGRMFVEPFDPPESQVYIMITNEAGEQFPDETIDRVADWINLGAPYYEE